MKAVKTAAIGIAVLLLAAFAVVMFFPVDSFVAKRAADVKGYVVPETYADAEYRYYYNKLSEDGQLAYRTAYAALLSDSDASFPKQIVVPDLDNEELKEVYSALSYDNPELFFLGNSCSMTSIGSVNYLIPTYQMTRGQYAELWNSIETVLSGILASVPETASSDYDKELFLHDYLVRHCEYSESESPYVYTMYGALVNGAANCEGYSRTMQYLLRALDIRNYLAVGQAEGSSGAEGHMWNIVFIDSNWYNLDVTWDDYSVTDVIDVPDNSVSHTYFNMSTEDMRKNHTADNEDLWSLCVADSFGYYRDNGVFFYGYDSVTEDTMKAALLLSLSSGYSSVEFAFKDKTTFDIAFDRLVNHGDMYNVIVYANSYVDPSLKVDTGKVQYAIDEENSILRFFFLR